MRDAFIEELVELAAIHGHIALVVGDLGYSVVEPFADRFPDRFINAGVAEQNMTGLAAGMASEGYHVFTYSIANFPTFRGAEQIRNDVDYNRLPVTVVAVGGGLAYGARVFTPCGAGLRTHAFFPKYADRSPRRSP
jgi:transketolase